jgi:hypothetical protein
MATGELGERWVRCPHCQAGNRPGADCCFLCHEPIPLDAEVVDASLWGAPQVPLTGDEDVPAPATVRHTFTLSSLMLLIALVAVTLGVFRIEPGLGIVLVIVVTPALIRTLLAVSRDKARGRALNPLEKVGVFVASLGIVIVIGLAAIIAFVATCVPIGLANSDNMTSNSLVTAVVIGLIAAGLVAFPLIRWLWPRKRV